MDVAAKPRETRAKDIKDGAIFLAEQYPRAGYRLHTQVADHGSSSGEVRKAWVNLEPSERFDEASVYFDPEPDRIALDLTGVVEFSANLQSGAVIDCYGIAQTPGYVYPVDGMLLMAARMGDRPPRRTCLFDLESGKIFRHRQPEMAIRKWEVRLKHLEGPNGLLYEFDGTDRNPGVR